jgi:DNA-binding transcriptional LysR family regulator
MAYITTMDPRQLQYFRVTAQREHVRHAADELGISESTLSRSIARLEDHYGERLFDRVNNGIKLNGFGRVVLARVERALFELENAERDVRNLRESGETLIAIGFLPSMGARVIPELIVKMRATNSHLNFRLVSGSGVALRDALLRGDIDFSIATHRFPDPAIDWQPLWNHKVVALVPPDHRLARRKEIDVREIGSDRLITFGPGHTIRQAVDELNRRMSFFPNIVFEGDDLATMVGLAAAGFGTALVVDTLEHLRHSATVLRLENSPSRTVGLATRKHGDLPEALTAFRNLVLATAEQRLT